MESDSILKELALFVREEKLWWMAPLLVCLLLVSAVLVFAEASALAPFIYPFF